MGETERETAAADTVRKRTPKPQTQTEIGPTSIVRGVVRTPAGYSLRTYRIPDHVLDACEVNRCAEDTLPRIGPKILREVIRDRDVGVQRWSR